MSFKSLNFSPVGNNARAGNVPQVFSYDSQDTLAEIITAGYFNELKGYLRRGDWLDIVAGNASDDQSMRFVTGDGRSPAAIAGLIIAGGATYAVGDLFTPTFTDGTVLQKPVFKVLTESSGAILTFSIVDPGLFDFNDMPTDFTALATTTDGSGTGATLTVFPSQSTGGILSADEGSSGGSGYSDGDTLSITFSDGTIFKAPIVSVTQTAGAVTGMTVIDPGSYDPTDPPTTLTDLATITLTGSGTGANADVVLADVLLGIAREGFLADITLSELAMDAA